MIKVIAYRAEGPRETANVRKPERAIERFSAADFDRLLVIRQREDGITVRTHYAAMRHPTGKVEWRRGITTYEGGISE